MNILLTNDDGIFALGIAAMAKALSRLGTVYVAAPAAEQSGVSQALTFHHPLLVKDVFVHGKRWGWAVEGTPADCVKVGVNFICPEKPDIVVSGINWGQNGGTNILYSGTLGAVFEAGMYHIPGFGVSIQDDELPQFDRAADIACQVIEQILTKIRGEGTRLDGCGNPEPQLFNINVSREAVKEETPEIVVCPMDTTPYATEMSGHSDAFGRAYYWLVPNGRGRRPECMTDMNGIGAGKVTVTPLRLDMTYLERLEEVESWDLSASLKEHQKPADEDFPNVPNLKTRTVMDHKVKREA